MITHYERRLEERRIIKAETKTTIFISISLLFSVLCMGLIAYFVKPAPSLNRGTLDKIWEVLNIVIVMMMVIILAVRKTIYYSPRFVKEDFSLTQILRKWRSIDLVLLAAAEIVPILGLVISLLGMPFRWTFHYFVASALLLVILMPIGLKVRSKLAELKKHRTHDWSLE